VGHAAEEVEDPAANRIEGFVGQAQAGGGIQLVDGQLARDAIGRRVHLLDEPLLLVELVANLADQLLEQVLERDEAGRPAVLVHHDGQVELLGLELAEQRVGPFRLGHEVGRVQASAKVEVRGQAAQVGQQVLGVEDADDLIHGLLEHRHPEWSCSRSRGRISAGGVAKSRQNMSAAAP